MLKLSIPIIHHIQEKHVSRSLKSCWSVLLNLPSHAPPTPISPPLVSDTPTPPPPQGDTHCMWRPNFAASLHLQHISAAAPPHGEESRQPSCAAGNELEPHPHPPTTTTTTPTPTSFYKSTNIILFVHFPAAETHPLCHLRRRWVKSSDLVPTITE